MRTCLRAICFVAFVSTTMPMAAVADSTSCSDRDYMIYLRYDKYLDDNASVSDGVLRQRFARHIGVKPENLKDLYMRCVARWSRENPEERRAYLKKELEGFARDCARRPADDPVCKSAIGK